MDIPYFIHGSFDGHFGRFYFWAIRNELRIIFVWTFSVLSGIAGS